VQPARRCETLFLHSSYLPTIFSKIENLLDQYISSMDVLLKFVFTELALKPDAFM